MKALLVIVIAALLVVGFCEKSSGEKPKPLGAPDVERLLKVAVDFKSLQDRNDVLYKINGAEAYNGWAKSRYDSGQAKALGRLKGGKADGPLIQWYENGQKAREYTYKDGTLDGPFRAWHKNGQKQAEGAFKDGNAHGPSTDWHENGQKRHEATFRDGMQVGPVRSWWENGQQRGEEIWKDGKKVSGKYWNREGGNQIDSEELKLIEHMMRNDRPGGEIDIEAIRRHLHKKRLERQHPEDAKLRKDDLAEQSGDDLAAAKKELASHLEYMAKVKADYNIQLGIINRLTANKKRPVREGSQAYYQCLAASKRIKAIEDSAGIIKAKKAELENRVRDLTEAAEEAP